VLQAAQGAVGNGTALSVFKSIFIFETSFKKHLFNWEKVTVKIRCFFPAFNRVPLTRNTTLRFFNHVAKLISGVFFYGKNGVLTMRLSGTQKKKKA